LRISRRPRSLALLLGTSLLVGACASGRDPARSDRRSAPPTTAPAASPGSTSRPTPVSAPPAFTVTGDRSGFAHGFELVRREGPEAVAADLDLMASTGARWLRAGLSWGSIETRPGVYDWAGTDRVVLGARARGLSVVAVVSSAPRWAAQPGCRSNECAPRDAAAYAAFLRVAVARYLPAGVHHWEIWNEPNHAAFWGPRADAGAYAAVLAAAYPAIHALDPEAVVLSGGLAPGGDTGGDIAPITFLRRLYQLGGGAHLDAVAHHPYHYPAPPDAIVPTNAFLQTLRLHQVMVEFGDGAKQIWGTEVGAPTRGAGQVSEADQARWVRLYYAGWNGWAFTGPLLWYTARDRGTADDAEDAFGLVRYDRSPKPALAAFEEMVQRSGPAPPPG
jgi:hypothetical protein